MLDLIVEYFPCDWILWTMQESYKQDRIYSCGEFDHTFPHTFNVLWSIVQIGCRENKIFQKKRRLKIKTHAKLLSNETRNANCNTSDQGVISHSRAIKKQTSVYLWSLKQPSALLFELLEKMMFMMNSMANFFLAALLFMRLLRMFFKLQSAFTDARRR